MQDSCNTAITVHALKEEIPDDIPKPAPLQPIQNIEEYQQQVEDQTQSTRQNSTANSEGITSRTTNSHRNIVNYSTKPGKTTSHASYLKNYKPSKTSTLI